MQDTLNMQEPEVEQTGSSYSITDYASFIEIYNAYAVRLLTFTTRMIGQAADAEDLVSEVFVTLLQLKDRFHTIQNIEAYLFRTVRNRTLQYLAHKKRMDLSTKTLQEHTCEIEAYSFEKDELMVLFMQRLSREVQKLPKQCRKVFILSFMEEKSNQDIADLMSINYQSVANIKSRAVKSLRAAMNEQPGREQFTVGVFLIWLHMMH